MCIPSVPLPSPQFPQPETSAVNANPQQVAENHSLLGPEVWINARLVQHNPCGVSTVRVRQNGFMFLVGVDKSSIHELSVTSRLDPIK